MLTKFQKCKKLQQGKKFQTVTIATILTIVTFATSIVFAGITGTKHDLSITGLGTIKAAPASGVTQKCVFCHTPHSSSKAGPLWNHSLSSATYVVCNPASLCSGTQKSLPDLTGPDGSSRLCLGCHDGTVAVGLLVNMPGSGMAGTVAMTQTYMTGNGLLGTNLTGKHLVSIVINNQFITDKKAQCNLSGTQGIQLPASSSPVKLYATTNKYGGSGGNGIQCRTCHDPHNETATTKCFLVPAPVPANAPPGTTPINCTACPCEPAPTNNYDALCYTCHYGPPCP